MVKTKPYVQIRASGDCIVGRTKCNECNQVFLLRTNSSLIKLLFEVASFQLEVNGHKCKETVCLEKK